MDDMTNSLMKLAKHEQGGKILIMLLILAFFIILLVAIFKGCEEKAQLKARIMREEGLSSKPANRMANLIQQRRWIFRRSLYSSDRRRHWTNMDAFLQHEFCTLMRWSKQIEKAKETPNSDLLCKELDRILGEMRLHANHFELRGGVKRELTSVCQLSEDSLRKYEMDFVGSVL